MENWWLWFASCLTAGSNIREPDNIVLWWTWFRYKSGEVWSAYWKFPNGMFGSVVRTLLLSFLCLCHQRNTSEPNWSAVIGTTSPLQLIQILTTLSPIISLHYLHCSGSKWNITEFIYGYVECFHCHVFIAIYLPCTDMKYISKYIFILFFIC